MDLVVEELDQLKRKLEITIPEEVVTQRINSAYSELNQQMRMPGFRPGKIPQNILEKQVPVQSFTNMLQALLQEYYEKALRESGLSPAGSPEIDHSKLQDVKKNTPLKFSVTLDVKPEIKIKGYQGLKLKKKETQVSKEELDRAIESILQQYGSFEHHEDGYKAQTGDYLTIDFEGQFEGQPLENGNATDLTVRIGEKKMINGFEEQLVGHKLGEEFEVKATLPANWNNKLRRVSTPLPGQEAQDLATFNVKIKELKKQVLPELTDAIAEKEGFETVD